MHLKLLAAAVALTALPATAQAQEWYVSAGGGLDIQSDSSNSGELTADFETGNGAPAVPTGTVLPAGTPVGWNTEIDNGFALSGEIGLRFDPGIRLGLEVSYTDADVATHAGVTVGGTNIDGVDAAVLTGSVDQLGATVGQVVADGQGRIKTLSGFANAYYDFNAEGTFQPYVGGGIGISSVDVRYNPSGVPIVDDSSTRFAYQLMAGATFRVTLQSTSLVSIRIAQAMMRMCRSICSPVNSLSTTSRAF